MLSSVSDSSSYIASTLPNDTDKLVDKNQNNTVHNNNILVDVSRNDKDTLATNNNNESEGGEGECESEAGGLFTAYYRPDPAIFGPGPYPTVRINI